MLVAIDLRTASAIVDRYANQYVRQCRSCGSPREISLSRCSLCGDGRDSIMAAVKFPQSKALARALTTVGVSNKRSFLRLSNSHFDHLIRDAAPFVRGALETIHRNVVPNNEQAIRIRTRAKQLVESISTVSAPVKA